MWRWKFISGMAESRLSGFESDVEYVVIEVNQFGSKENGQDDYQ